MWPNVERSLDFFLAFERESRGEVARIQVECGGAISFALSDGEPFTLTARADRIDVLRSGGGRLIDYKSGAPPGPNEVKVGFAPQLTLEAAILKRGGFKGIGALEPERAIYVKLGGMNGGALWDAAGARADASVAALADEHLSELKALLDQFAHPRTPYLSRPFPKFASRFSAYDHLARVKEWSATGGGADAGEES
jgi:ATP-dependent helicase/nuclease subunit B